MPAKMMPTVISDCTRQKGPEMKPGIVAVDLFCGVGGLTHGLEQAGVAVRLGVDIDPQCAYAYQTNNNAEFLEKSVEAIGADDLQDAFGDANIRLIAGCAPCQPFSTYSQKKRETVDRRWTLLRAFSQRILDIKPELVTMENVPGLAKQRVFREFVTGLESAKYHVAIEIVDCSAYGVPQVRRRLVLLASKLGSVKLLTPAELRCRRRSVSQAIRSLPVIRAGNACKSDALHCAAGLSPINKQRIGASVPGGTWRDWPNALVAKCHKKDSGERYQSVYGRMTWRDPAPTITTQFYNFGSGRYGHPAQARAITLREGAILQSFPKNYRFVAPGDKPSLTTIGRLIGNAVPVKLGKVIGTSLLRHIQSGQSSGKRQGGL
jgi:DNA (cytosine-5)-methyltransferase 1